MGLCCKFLSKIRFGWVLIRWLHSLSSFGFSGSLQVFKGSGSNLHFARGDVKRCSKRKDVSFSPGFSTSSKILGGLRLRCVACRIFAGGYQDFIRKILSTFNKIVIIKIMSISWHFFRLERLHAIF